jgi:hypothetical protein
MKTRIVKRKKGYLVQEKILFFFWSCAICDYTPLDVFNIYFKTHKEAEEAERHFKSGNYNGTITPRIHI